jgi:PPK2 family polyphosphate:nucleotide phosphotransferase
MDLDKIVKNARAICKPYKIANGKHFKLKKFNPGDTAGFKSEDKPRVKEGLLSGIEALAELQGRLYAEDRWSVLLIFQAMDAAGKDGAIKHVMSGINPQGCEVYSFKAPSVEELDHDFMWRTSKSLPQRGRFGVFNRSYYEEVLVVRVHPEILGKERLPLELVTKKIWNERFADIRAFERYLSRNGVLVLKFFLHVSKAEQLRRFMERLDKPDKNWKFSSGDAKEREHWGEYMAAYEDAIRETSTKEAPWFVVPADNKWFTRLVVAAAVIDALGKLNLEYPQVDKAQAKELAAARALLLKQK